MLIARSQGEGGMGNKYLIGTVSVGEDEKHSGDG